MNVYPEIGYAVCSCDCMTGLKYHLMFVPLDMYIYIFYSALWLQK